MVAMLHVHPSRAEDLREPDELQLTPAVPVDMYHDSYGNICTRFVAPAGQLRLYNSTLVEVSGDTDPVSPGARQVPVQHLPSQVLQYLLASRYCEVDHLLNIAGTLFTATEPVYAKAMATGHAMQDTAAVCAVLEKMAGVKRARKARKKR